jgi:alginate O-acetyltransferase complex protein AlgI
MLLLVLIAFGICGILFSSVTKNRSLFILCLSALAIGLFSFPSLLFCFFLSAINYLLLKSIAQKKWLFISTIALNILGLFTFHIYEHLYEEWGGIPLLFGFSYLTFQFIDYACKVYFKQIPSPTGIIYYLSATLYVPKFFMGPITSLPELDKYIRTKKETSNNFAYGLNRVLLGLFKKLVLAESLSLYVHSVLDFKDTYPGITILSGAFLFALQLYFDFSGYSDMAIGVSAMWSIPLPENFNFPFRQKTWASFWQSWHSSLTYWLWQYVFNPLYLYFSRRSYSKIITQSICIIVVFSCMALFNGIKSGFFISALLYALFYFAELTLNRKKSRLSGIFIFLLFSISLLFFRSPNYSDYSFLVTQLTNIPLFFPNDWLRLYFAPLASGGTLQDYFNFSFTMLLCLLFLLFERKIVAILFQNKINYLMWFALLLLLTTWGIFTSGDRFIYMQF